MTGQADLFARGLIAVPFESGPLKAVCPDLLSPPVPRAHVVERAWPDLKVYTCPLEQLPRLPLQWVTRPGGSVAADVGDDAAVSAAQCNVCGTPATGLLRSGHLDLWPSDRDYDIAMWTEPRFMTVMPCGHNNNSAIQEVGLVTVVMEGLNRQQVVDWLYCWAGYYLLTRGVVEPDHSPPPLFTPSVTGPAVVLDVWLDEETP